MAKTKSKPSAWVVAAAILYREGGSQGFEMHLEQLAFQIEQTKLSNLGSRGGSTTAKTLRTQMSFNAPLLPGVDKNSALMFCETSHNGCALNNPKLAITHPEVANVFQILAQKKKV